MIAKIAVLTASPSARPGDRHSAESAVLLQNSHSQPHVARQMVKKHPAGGFVEPLLGRRSISEGLEGGQSRLCFGQALRTELVSLQLQMGLDLRVEVLLPTLPAHDIPLEGLLGWCPTQIYTRSGRLSTQAARLSRQNRNVPFLAK